ncbi:MAG: ROK family transcriptional regulator [Clostridiales bacterium]|nr:ROK family transcriptional regulator [Clostridiales bacterium]
MKRATNASVMRASNRKLILNQIRLGPVSRVELSERTCLTRASVTQIVDELIGTGLIEPVRAVDRGERGRRRIQLAIRPDARYAFGVSIKRKRCDVGVVDLSGNVKAEQTLSIKGREPEEVLREVAGIIAAQKKSLALDDRRILGVGVSAPGPIDYLDGRILNPPNFSAWHNLPVCERIRALTGMESMLEKDTNASALEERFFGAAREVSSFMLLLMEEGVGSGVMIQDRLYRGMNGLGSELGHTSIRHDGRPCNCGHIGCLETYVSTQALLEGTDYPSWEALARDEKNPAAHEIIDRAAEYLACALVNAVNLYDIEQVILTGDVEKYPAPLLNRLNPLLHERAIIRVRVRLKDVIMGCTAAPVRAGAMAVLYDLFQDRA